MSVGGASAAHIAMSVLEAPGGKPKRASVCSSASKRFATMIASS